MQKIDIPHSDWEIFISDFNSRYSRQNISIFEIADNSESSVIENISINEIKLSERNNSYLISIELNEHNENQYSIDHLIKISIEQKNDGRITRLNFYSRSQHQIIIKLN